ncbi:hypothetical protein ACS0TY_029212 [Phlomoides rotata]
MAEEFTIGCQLGDLSHEQLKQAISRTSQLIRSIPDKARRGAPTSLSPHIFFKRLTTQPLHGAEDRDLKLTSEKILDVPDLLGDYYLNLLDWGSNNVWDRSMASAIAPTQRLHKLEEHTAAVKALTWCLFQLNLLASRGGCINIWNTNTGACLNSVDTCSQVCALLWSKNEPQLLSSQGNGPVVSSVNPVDNQPMAEVPEASIEDYEEGMQACASAAMIWMQVPAPKRGEIVWQIGDALRTKLHHLGRLVSLEMGKILAEGIGEVQEIIDMCDFAVGLSRQLNGSVIPSERPNHMMLEMWNPLGIVNVITAFNFPCAVLGWNAYIALVCGNAVVWKGTPITPLFTIATTKIIAGVLEKNNLPSAIFTAFCEGAEVGQAIANDPQTVSYEHLVS